jgi:hypothetical protein
VSLVKTSKRVVQQLTESCKIINFIVQSISFGMVCFIRITSIGLLRAQRTSFCKLNMSHVTSRWKYLIAFPLLWQSGKQMLIQSYNFEWNAESTPKDSCPRELPELTEDTM